MGEEVAGIAALSRRDIDGALAPFHPDLKFRDAGTGRSERGRERFAEMLAKWLRWVETRT